MAVRHDKKIAMVHIPKSAGVAIVNNFNMNPKGNHSIYKFYRETYPNYFLFAVTRNPYDRIISSYEFMISFDKRYPNKRRYSRMYEQGFEFMCENLKHFGTLLLRPQTFFVCDNNNNIQVDKILNFENDMWSELYEIFNEVVEPKKYNTTIRSKTDKYYNKRTKKLVYDYYKEDFDLFNYREWK